MSMCLSRAALAWLLGLWLVAPAWAQVSQPTEADKANVPLQFRPDDQKNGAVTSFAPRGTPPGYTPNADLRDFTGSYVTENGGGPGAPRGPPGGPPGAGRGGPGGPPPNPNARRPSCVPTFGYGAYAVHVVASPGRLTVVGEENHRIRRIYLNEPLPENPTPAYAGNSVGHWEHNTLVIDTVGIKGRSGVHQRERWTREKNGSIAIETSVMDGDAPRSTQREELVWRPDLSYVENICEDFAEAFGSGYGSSKSQ